MVYDIFQDGRLPSIPVAVRRSRLDVREIRARMGSDFRRHLDLIIPVESVSLSWIESSTALIGVSIGDSKDFAGINVKHANGSKPMALSEAPSAQVLDRSGLDERRSIIAALDVILIQSNGSQIPTWPIQR